MENRLKRQAKMLANSDFLPITLLREKQKTDVYLLQNEPTNKLTNVLTDDSSHYRNKQPVFEFDLYNGHRCYIGEVIVDPNEPAPGDTEIYVSDEKSIVWRKVEFTPSGDKPRRYVLRDEVFGAYLQIRFLNNERRGNFVGIRLIKIRGIRQEHIMI